MIKDLYLYVLSYPGIQLDNLPLTLPVSLLLPLPVPLPLITPKPELALNLIRNLPLYLTRIFTPKLTHISVTTATFNPYLLLPMSLPLPLSLTLHLPLSIPYPFIL